MMSSVSFTHSLSFFKAEMMSRDHKGNDQETDTADQRLFVDVFQIRSKWGKAVVVDDYMLVCFFRYNTFLSYELENYMQKKH